MPRERRDSPEQDPIQQSLDTLERSVAAIQDSETFRAYLTAQGRFHQYSFSNVLLILAQKPDATRVAGYRAWQSMDRHVLKGEKAIRILAPLRKKETDEKTGEENYRVFGFRAASVFDVSQTDGEPLPEVSVPVLAGEEGKPLWDRMKVVAEEEGYQVIKGNLTSPTMMGYTSPQERLIMVKKDIPQIQRTKTLAHELGHVFARHGESNPSTETEAEGIAYVVLAKYGLDSGERSFPYVATWAKDKNTLRAALGQIQRVSQTIIGRLEPEAEAETAAP